MKRKVASRKYLFCEKYSAGPEQGRLFPLLRGVFLVRKEGFPERKLLERGSDALSALLSRSSCFHFALHDSLRDTRPYSPEKSRLDSVVDRPDPDFESAYCLARFVPPSARITQLGV